MLGKTIQNYKIYSILGEGGMGVVYKAFDIKLERYVAIKILKNPDFVHGQFIERFKREAKNQAKMNHPNIVQVFGFVEDADIMGIVMEYVEGESLEQLVERKGRLDLEESLYLIKQVLAGVSYAHNKGFIHRDIKPSNVIINREGIAKLMDFGISKSMDETGITKTGAKIGTILYMSPEQVRAEEPTRQSDIYSIGITLFEMLAGRTPFEYKTEFEIMEAHLKKNAPKLAPNLEGLPSETDVIIAKALDKNIFIRYGNCDEFLEDVNHLIQIISSAPVKSKENKIKKRRLNFNWKSWVIGGISFVLFVIFGMIAYNIAAKIWIVNFGFAKQKDTELSKYTGYSSNPLYKQRSNWTALDTKVSGNLNSVYFLSDSVGFACGDSGTVIKTTDAGSSWRQIELKGINKRLYDIKFASWNTGYIVGEGGLFLVSNNSGESWDAINVGSSASLFKIYAQNNICIIAGYNGVVFRSSDGGHSWNKAYSSGSLALFCMKFTDDKTGFIAGKDGAILKTTDKGVSWNKLDSFTSNYIKDLDFSDSQSGLTAGGTDIFRTKDGGKNWDKLNFNLSTALSGIRYIGYSTWIAISSNGKMFITDDFGKTWSSIAGGSSASLTSIFKTNKNIYITGSDGIMLRMGI